MVAWTKRPKTAQALAMRSRIVLLAADGCSNTWIAQQLSATARRGKWRKRFLDQRWMALDEPRPGTPRKLMIGRWNRYWRERWRLQPSHALVHARHG